MFDNIQNPEIFDPRRDCVLDPLATFVEAHRDALLDAAAMLAGRRGVRLARSAIDGLTETPVPSRSVMHDLDNLLDILMLEHVHDISREEAALFAAIDPMNPCVEELCLLADGLRDAIDGSRARREEAGVRQFSRRAAA